MSEIEPPVDWRETHARLERSRQALEAGARVSPEELHRILKKRAEALASPLRERRIPAESLELVVFSLSGERYAVDAEHVQAVVPLREITPLPCSPSFVLGVVNHRGRILPVLDLRRLFGLVSDAVPEDARLVVAEAGGMQFAIFADGIAGTIRIEPRKLAAPPVTLTGDQKTWLAGVTADMIVVLDLEAMVRESRIVVNEEVS